MIRHSSEQSYPQGAAQPSAGKRFRRTLLGRFATAFGLVVPTLLILQPSAHALPAATIGRPALIRPLDAESAYPTSLDTTHTPTLGSTAPAPPETLALTRALGKNPDEIYDFVHNYIDTVFIFGSQKGPAGTIVDKSGTPFDQAQLMVTLLRQAGYTASYKVGTITLNGTDFASWTNVTNAQAACDLLASGGIPATINGGSSSVQCSSIAAGTTVSSVTMEHIWVDVVIMGTDYLFDPSFKKYDFSPQLNLNTAAGLTTGQAFTAATTGQTSSSASGVNYVKSLSATGLNTTLTSYASGLQNYIQTGNFTPVGQSTPAPLASARVINLVGGREIHHDQVPLTGLRQTTLPYVSSSVTRTWTGDIPDQFRTKLNVQLKKCLATDVPGSLCTTTIINQDIYTDDIYSRRLVFNSQFISHGTGFTGTLDVIDDSGVKQTLASTPPNQDPPTLSVGTLTLTLNHPYAADAAGSTSAAGTYMDTVFSRYFRYSTPFAIVYGLGDANRGLIDKWGDVPDQALPLPPPTDCDPCVKNYFDSAGDGRRQQLAAAWLVQSSKAARLHAAIANSVYTHHHSLGIVAGDTVITAVDQTPQGATRTYIYSVQENFDRVDIETGYSVTSLTYNTADRRAAVHAIAATLDALEGSVAGQLADLPDTVSTAVRFEWGNSPPTGEDPSAHGARRFYDFNNGNIAPIQSLLLVEGVNSTTATGQHPAGGSGIDPVIIGAAETGAREGAVSSLVSSYASSDPWNSTTNSGWDVIASEEAFLGPGQRGGAFTPTGIGTTYTHNFTEQRGGALIATRYSNGDPIQIAHIAANVNPGAPNTAQGMTNGIKGGGGGAQTNHDSVYDPSKAADILKTQFVDRSNAIGVDLNSGQVTYTSPAALKVGNGDFPFSLTGELIWRGGERATNGFAPISHVEPQAPFTSNWNNTLTISGSGLEAMGETDIRTSAGTVAAFMAMQDIYRQPISAQREVAAALTSAWWMHQLSGNVVTANLGADTQQFVRRYDGSWLKPGAGDFASLTQNNQRTVYAQTLCTGTAGYTTTRGWDYSNVSYVVTNAHGDKQNFQFWSTNYFNPGDNYCGFFHGFRLKTWTFPYGMTVTLNYQSEGSGLFDDLVSVSNSIGRQINLISNGLGGFNNGLAAPDLRTVTVTPASPGPLDTTVTHTDPAGVQTQFNFGGSVKGLVLNSVYTNVGPMSSATAAPTTPVLAYKYDPLGQVMWAQDGVSLQNPVSSTYCDNHPLTPPANRAPYCFYFAAGARADRIDPAVGDYTIVNDIYRLPHWYVDEVNRTTTVTHDGRGRVLSYLFPEQNQEIYTYDDHNNTTQLTRKAKPNSSLADISVSATWDQTWNKPLTITQPVTSTTTCLTTFAYYPTSVAGTSLIQNAVRCKPDAAQANPTYSFTYNAIGQPLQTTDPSGLVTLNTYEPGNTGNLQSTAVDPTGVNSVTSFTYYASGLMKTTSDPRLYVTERQYDLDDRNTLTLHHDLGGITAASMAADRTTFDTLGRVTQKEGGITFSGAAVTGWQNLQQMTYSLTNKVLTDQDAAGNPTTYAYDPMDRVQLVTDPAGHRVATVYDAAGQTFSVWRGWDSTTAPTSSTAWDPSTYSINGKIRYAKYQYSLNGKQTQILDGNNNVTNLAYDGHDRPLYTLFTDPAAASNTCTVAAATVSGYDNIAPTCNTTLPHQQTYEKYSYYPDGSQSAVRKRDGQVISFDIDALGREVVKHLPGTATGDVYFAYDLAGRPTSAVFGSATGTGVVYGFDTAKRMTSETTFGRSVGYGYDAANNRTSVSWPDISTSIVYDFDGLNRAWRVHESGTTSGPGLLAVYGYDSLSHRTSITRGNGVNTGFGYDSDLRLQALTHDPTGTAQDLTLSFSYTLASQLQKRQMSNSLYTWAPAVASKTYVTDALNRYTSINGTTTTLSYDGRSNLAGDGTRSFTYDIENHLLTETGGPAPLTLSYDPLGRLYQSISGSTTTQFLYAGNNLIGEYSTSGTALRRYAHGPGTDNPIVWYEGSALTNRQWLLADERGSIVAKTDSSGTATAYTYGPFGEPSTWAGPRFAYTGQISLPEAQLYHYKARVYDPVLGRFLQTDPVGTADDINLYAYGRGDPINRQDMGGTWSANVHTKVMVDAFGLGMGLAMVPASLRQDLAHGHENYMHFLRDPGQSPGKAIANYKSFVLEKLELARSLNNTGDFENRALALTYFTQAVHATMDSFSPAHNHGGNPVEYDPSWGPIESAHHDHSPLNIVGQETTEELTPAIEKAMIKQLHNEFDYVYKNGPKPNLDIPAIRTNHCAESVSCKSGSDIEWWN